MSLIIASKETVRKSTNCSDEEMISHKNEGKGLFIGTGCPAGEWDCKLVLINDKPKIRQQVIGYKDALKNDVYNSLFFARMSLNNPTTKVKATAEVTVNEALANIIESGDIHGTFGVNSTKVKDKDYTTTKFQEKPFFGEDFIAAADQVAGN